MVNGDFEIDVHEHPIGLKEYGLETIIDSAIKNNLDAVALVDYNNHIFPEVKEMAKKFSSKYKIRDNKEVIQITNYKENIYLIDAIEVMTKENIHVIGLGNTGYKESSSIYDLLKSEISPLIIDHPLVDASCPWKKVSKEKEKEIENICKDYGDKIALEWNGYCLDYIWKIKVPFKINGVYPLGCDVNKKTEELAEKYSIPLVADTDLHGWDKELMQDLGKSRIKIPLPEMDFNLENIVPSIKQAILNKKYENVKKYVSLWHFLKAFGGPMVMNRVNSILFKHVRGKVKQ